MVDTTERRSVAGWVTDARVARVSFWVADVIVLLAIQQRFWPAPAGVLLKGAVVGGLTALIAFGIALTYRSNRIINFAQGDLGGVPAALGALLVLSAGVPYLLAVPVVLLTAVVLGAFVEFVFIRRFFTAPRLILTVVTIGLSQILALVTTALPQLFDRASPQNVVPPPFDLSITISGVVFDANELIAMAAVPLILLGLTAFLRYTDIGIAIRASAQSADRAALLGVPVKRIQTVVWVITTLLAAIAIFLRAGILGLPIGSVLGPTVLVRALAACVVGRMERMSVIVAASLGLGMLESAVVFSTGRSALVDPILFVVIIVALLVQSSKTGTREDAEASSWQAARQVRPVPRELRRLPEVVWGRRLVELGGAAVLFALPLVATEGQLNLLGVVILFAIVGISLVVLTGWAGQVSLGQVAFFGIGAGVAGYLSAGRGWDMVAACLAAALVGGLVAVLIGLPALRISGLFLAVVTISFALATSHYLLDPQFITWLPTGSVPRTPLFGRISVASETSFYLLCVVVLLLTIGAVRSLRASRTGRVLIGARENPRAAQSFGVDVTVAKLTAFGISGFLAALAGALFVHHQQRLGISAYSVDESREAFIQVVIGGLGSVPGALLGATFIQGVSYFSTSMPSAIRPLLGFLTSGIGLIFVLLLLPGGFSQVYYDLRDRLLRWVARRHDLVVPSLIADTDQPPDDPVAAGDVGVQPSSAVPSTDAPLAVDPAPDLVASESVR